MKVIQIDTIYERSGDRYIGGWINNYYFVGPYGKGTYISYNGWGNKGTKNNHGYQGIKWEFNKDGDTTFKGKHVSDPTKRIRGRNGHGIETSITRESKKWNQYIGEFKWDKKHGKGVLTFSDGRVRDGLWEYGKFLGEETFDIELSKSKVVPQSVQKLCVLEVK